MAVWRRARATVDRDPLPAPDDLSWSESHDRVLIVAEARDRGFRHRIASHGLIPIDADPDADWDEDPESRVRFHVRALEQGALESETGGFVLPETGACPGRSRIPDDREPGRIETIEVLDEDGDGRCETYCVESRGPGPDAPPPLVARSDGTRSGPWQVDVDPEILSPPIPAAACSVDEAES